MQRKSKSSHVDKNKWVQEETSMARFDALIRQGKYVEAANLRPEYIDRMIKLKLIRRVKQKH